MEVETLIWDWISQTLFGDDNFWCKEDWTPDSTTKFGQENKIKSMQEDLSPLKMVGS